jgi:hypothetical protein
VHGQELSWQLHTFPSSWAVTNMKMESLFNISVTIFKEQCSQTYLYPKIVLLGPNDNIQFFLPISVIEVQHDVDRVNEKKKYFFIFTKN